MNQSLETWSDQQKALEYLEVTYAYLSSWTGHGYIASVTSAEGRLYHRRALENFKLYHAERLLRAQRASRQAQINRTIKQLTFAYHTDP